MFNQCVNEPGAKRIASTGGGTSSRALACGKHFAGLIALHRHTDVYRSTGLFVWLDARICPDHRIDRSSRVSRRHNFRYLAQPISRSLVAQAGNVAWQGQRPEIHADNHVRKLSLSRGAVPRCPHRQPYADDPRAVAVAEAARSSWLELRDRWLNPPEWVEWTEEPVPEEYPQRPVPRDEATAAQLKRRTLTNLYNARPQWLADAHAALDAAVAAAYGWPANVSVDDALRELLTINLSGSS